VAFNCRNVESAPVDILECLVLVQACGLGVADSALPCWSVEGAWL